MSEEPRVPLLDDEASAQVGDEYNVPPFQMSLSVFRVLMRHPTLGKSMNNLGTTLIVGGKPPDCEREAPKLDPRLRELAIMRIGWLGRSVYEWAQHWAIAKRFGVPEDELVAVRDWRSHGGFGSEERAVLTAVDETFADGEISDQTWAELAAFLDYPALVELVVAIGHWRMYATLLRSMRVPLEEGMEAWPPDGVAPPE